MYTVVRIYINDCLLYSILKPEQSTFKDVKTIDFYDITVEFHKRIQSRDDLRLYTTTCTHRSGNMAVGVPLMGCLLPPPSRFV